MFPLVARRLLAALLAVAMTASPVAANASTCCRTALAEGISGEHACCCADRAGDDAQAMSCCSAAGEDELERPCCAKKRRAEVSVSAAPSPCCCKARQDVPAVAEGRYRFDQRDAHFFSAWAIEIVAVGRHVAMASATVNPCESLPGMALHKLHCRWTV